VRFSGEAERFMRVGGDRLVSLAGLLASLGLEYSVARTGKSRHLLVRIGRGAPALTLVAHYDRVAGSPGALDNSCACLQLAEFAARRAGGPARARPPLLIAFTDAEEAPGSGEASAQGSFALARALKAAGGEGMSALVLDVTGRGGRLLLSTAPAGLLERNGLAASPAAEGYRALASLARRAASGAGLRPPIDAELPWSDDLGLTLGGLPALALSLLPDDEVPLVAAGRRAPTWELLHGPEDVPELAEPGAFALMASFLDALALELAPGT
jgi:hypothetical protein